MKQITEFLLSKNHKKTISRPEKDCTLDDLVNWIESYGIPKAHYASSPKPGCILYARSPNENDAEYSWVSVRTHPKTVKNREQNIIIKPYIKIYQINDIFGSSHKVSFDEAMDMLEQVLLNKDLILYDKHS